MIGGRRPAAPPSITKAASTDQIPLHEWITDVAVSHGRTASASRLNTGLSVLATTGSTAPFVGLFGTVWGIYNALIQICLAGQAFARQDRRPDR